MLWVGILVVGLAGAFGLAAGWVHIHPWGRAGIGAAAGVAFLVAGGVLGGRTSRVVTEGISACGVVLLYLSVWATGARYQLVEVNVALVGMAVVTAVCVVLAVAYDARGLMFIAMVGGYVTPVVLRSSEGASGNPHYLLGYLAVLNAGVLGASLARRWRVVHGTAFGVMCAWMLVWLPGVWQRVAGQEWTVFGYLTAYFLLFVGVASAYSFWFRRPTSAEDVLLLVSVASAYLAGGLYALPAGDQLARGVFAAALAGWWGAVAYAGARRLPDDRTLRVTCVALALCLLAIAFPLLFEGHALVVAWSLEAVALAVVGWATGRRAVGNTGLVVYVLATIAMAIADTSESGGYDAWVASPPWPTFVVLVAAGIACTALARAFSRRHAPVLVLENALASLTVLTMLWFELRGVHSVATVYEWFAPEPEPALSFLLVSVVVLHGLASILLGIATRLPGLRWAGLIPAGIATVCIPFMACAGGDAMWSAFANTRVLAFGAVVVACAALVWARRRHAERFSPPEAAALGPEYLGALAGAAFVWPAIQESYRAVTILALPSADTASMAGCFAALAAATVAGAACVFTGFPTRLIGLRWVGALTVGGGAVGLPLLAAVSAAVDWPAFGNARAAAFIVAIATCAALAWECRRADDLAAEEERVFHPELYATVAALLALWVATQETCQAVRTAGFPTPATCDGAIPFVTAIVWAAGGAACLLLGYAVRLVGPRWVGIASLCLSMATTAASAAGSGDTDWTPFVNIRAAAFLAAIAVCALLTWETSRRAALLTPAEARWLRREHLAAAIGVLSLWVTAQETFLSVAQRAGPADVWAHVARFAMLLVWTAGGMACALVGFRARLTGLRWVGVAGVALSVALAAGYASASDGVDWLPFLNIRAATFAALIGACLALGWMAARSGDLLRRWEAAILNWEPLAALAGLLVLWPVTQELAFLIRIAEFPSADTWGDAVLFAEALAWVALGTAWVLVGFATRLRGLRGVGHMTSGVPVALLPVLAVACGGGHWTPFANLRAAAFAAVVVACVVVAREFRRRERDLTPGETSVLRPEHAGTVAGFMLLWLLTQETYSVFRVRQFPSEEMWPYAGQLAVSLVWTLYAGAVMAAGIALRRMRFRIAALGVFGLALLKVFFYDLSFLSGQYRTFSFGALGLVLIGVAVLYGRYREVIFGGREEAEEGGGGA
jgi:uncharacterized membrane protein